MTTKKTATVGIAAEQTLRPVTRSTAYSSESGRTYRLDKLVGKGGFGEDLVK